MPDYRPFFPRPQLVVNSAHERMLESLDILKARIPNERVAVLSSYYSHIPWVADDDGRLLFEYTGRYRELYDEYGMNIVLYVITHCGGVYHHLALEYPDGETRLKVGLAHGLDIEVDIERYFVSFTYDGL